MLPANRIALKEWAVVVRALIEGRQMVLLRKGGTDDPSGEFRLEHKEFFLYPTFEHQNRKFIRPEFLANFDQAIHDQPAGEEVVISAYAVVPGRIVTRDLGKLRQLKDWHVWNDEYLEMRLNYKPESPLELLILRAYETAPVRITPRPEYRGCKSWVELDRDLSTEGARLAVPSTELRRRWSNIRELLGVPRVQTAKAQGSSGKKDEGDSALGPTMEILLDVFDDD